MLAGCQCKTQNYTVHAYWPTLGDRRDFSMYCEVGQWIGKNAKVLDKKSAVDCLRLIREQFTDLQLVDVKDSQGRLARA
jgi:hypothetical protein